MKTDIMRWLAIWMCVVGLSAAGALPAEAVPSFFGSNAYEFVQVTDPFTGSNNTWATASAAAAASIFGGVNGHLATITSQAENNFLFGLGPGGFSGFAGAWLGGVGDLPQSGHWLVGPEAGQPFSFVNFGGIEPNNAGLVYMNIGASFAGIAPGQWADEGVNGIPTAGPDPVVGYFIEWERPAAVPEPGTMALVALGLLSLLARRGRQ